MRKSRPFLASLDELAGIAAAEAKVTTTAKGSASPTVFIDLGIFTTAGEHTLIGDLLRTVGARDVVGASVDSGPVSPARIAHLDPQIYLASSDSGTTLADLRKDPLLRKVKGQVEDVCRTFPLYVNRSL